MSSTSVGGHTYRLTSGWLYVYGPDYANLYLSGDEESVSVALRTGSYSAYLSSFSLARDDGNGNFVPVEARLITPYMNFDIFNGTATTLSLLFETDGALVRMGVGGLNVRVDVTESAATCTPFTDDCGDGSWCPPTELTGRQRECFAAGATALGEPCSGPLDCAADSSCFDFGDGPVCAELCPDSLFDEPCSETTLCLAAGSDYGVCTPVAAEAAE